MAGDWIKMRSNLWDDPRVAKLCDLTDQTEAAVIGGLYWLWASADQHSEDGCMPGLTLRQIDRKTCIPGFGAALCEIGWLTDEAPGVVIQRFEEHNGTSAKRRCTDAQRKATGRSLSALGADIEQTRTGQKSDGLRRNPELEKEKEKRKEEKEIGSPKVIADSSATGKPAAAKRGTRLPDEFALPKAWGEWALTEYPHWQAETVRVIAAGFSDHWHAKAGKDAAKLDWQATWRTWCRSEITQRHFPTPKPIAGAVNSEEAAAALGAATTEAARRKLFGHKETIDV